MYLLGEGRGLGGKEKDRTIPQSVKQYHKNLPEETQACHPKRNKKHHSEGTGKIIFLKCGWGKRENTERGC